MQKLKKIIFAVSLGLLLANPTLVFAQGTNTSANGSGIKSNAIDVAEYKGVEGSISQYLCTPTEGSDNGKDLEMCINKIYRFGIAFGAIALVFFVVFAGYLYITGGEQGKGRAKGIINNALVGMALLLGSYVILYFINPSLTVIKPIQPPIFSAPDLPTCDAVGFGEKCVIAGSGGGGISTGGNKCSVPVTASAQNGKYNNSLHGETGSGHGPVRTPPNGAPPLGTVDVGVKGGSPVYAAISGKVVKYGDLGTFGKYVSIISDPEGGEFGCEKSNACANQAHIEPTVKVGDMVTAGQQIGTMTNYVGDMGPHLHIELKLNGQWITGDGKKGTWDNMKAACAASGSSSGSGNNSAVAVDINPSGMTEVTAASHGVIINMKYASADNFTGVALYKQSKCYLTQTMANQLKAAQTALAAKGKKLEIFDCYRPPAVQTLMNEWAKGTASWASKKPNESYSFYVPKYIAAAGSGKHPSGQAIDLTISGASMPSAFDTFSSSAAYPTNPNADVKLLRDVMVGAGFGALSSEWWHFSE